jgi:hypothetical protein
MHGRNEKCIEILVIKSGGKRTLRRPRHKWEDNIKMDLREIEWEGVDWIHMAHYRIQWKAFMNTIMNLQVS